MLFLFCNAVAGVMVAALLNFFDRRSVLRFSNLILLHHDSLKLLLHLRYMYRYLLFQNGELNESRRQRRDRLEAARADDNERNTLLPVEDNCEHDQTGSHAQHA